MRVVDTRMPEGASLSEVYRLDDLLIDVAAARVERGSEAIGLPPLSFDTLVCLLRRAPDVLTVEELARSVWRDVAVADETVVQRLALLRKALGDDSRQPRYVRSVRGKGYQLAAPAMRVERATADTSISRRPHLAVMAGLATILAALIFLRGGDVEPSDDAKAARPSASVEELIERGRDYLARHRQADNEIAVELFRQALDRSPDEPAALAGLSLAYSHRVTKFDGAPSWSNEAQALAERALAVTPNSAEAFHALGFAWDSQSRIQAALEAYRRAVEIDSRHAGALASAAYLMAVRGDLVEALEWNLRAAALDADVPYLELQIAQVLARLELDAAAEAWFEKSLALRPDNLFVYGELAAFYLGKGRREKALELVERARALGIDRHELLLVRGTAELLAGDADTARTTYETAAVLHERRPQARYRLLMLDCLETEAIGDELAADARAAVGELRASRAEGDEWPGSSLEEALLHGACGRPRDALVALDEAIDRGYRDADGLLIEPMLAPVRGVPEFWPRIERIRQLVAAAREEVLAASWLPAEVLELSRSSPVAPGVISNEPESW